LASHWTNLERLWFSVRHQADVEIEWRPKIEKQQTDIMNKLSKFGEDALKKLAAMQKEQLNELQYDEPVNPEFVDNLKATSPQRFPPFNHEQARIQDSVNGNLSGSSKSMSTSPSMDNLIQEATQKADAAAASSKSNVEPGIKKSLSTMDLLGGGPSSGLTNEYLAHELILDPDFKLKPKELSPLSPSPNISQKSLL